MSDDPQTGTPESIAIIGMAGRFPGARDLKELWANLRDGVDSIRDLTDGDLRESGLDPATLPPHYVKSAAVIDDVELFDAGFFNFSAREAELLDPQSRVFLECSWQALESAGYASESYPGWVGVFGGVSLPAYLMSNLLNNPAVIGAVDPFQILLANDRDYFATRVAYKLDLRGPALNVQTACSTSLVAVHLACQSLLSYQCTLALAGGIRIGVPQKTGYFAPEGGIFSPDGRCRAFDAAGKGALFGEGVGVVVLKRLSEALADGDPIHAVILGSAFNNDGSMKVGYTAPSVEGQAEVIALAQAVAGVDPETISYVEAHGSGTPLGDPIEVAALTRAFRAGTEARGFCALGSVKTNVGHLESAAGIAGLIKTTLSLENRAIPPSLHFETPNPRIDFESSPFYVNTELRDWPRNGTPRRAAVSSFGMGGTNVHAVLEEAPEREPSGPSRPWQLLVLSARTETALERMTENLAGWLEAHPEAPLADVAFTLQSGRRTFPYRRALVCRDREDALAGLRDGRRLLGSVQEKAERPVAFLLSGLGDHYEGMSAGLYRGEPAFREAIDRAAGVLRSEGIDLLSALYPKGTDQEEEGGKTDLRAMLGRGGEAVAAMPTEVAQPAVFAVEYALAQVLAEWGIRPTALAGYSLGEYTAACLAGVFPFEDALRLVARRARLIGRLAPGAMLSMALPEDEARVLVTPEISLAAINGPVLSVLAGPVAAVEALEKDLGERGVATRRLPTTHAFHSRMMEPLRGELRDLLRGVQLSAPAIPYLSNVTGSWVTPEQAMDPEFWVRHLVEPVRFGDSLAELLREPERVLLEVGPGQGLTSLALQLAEGGAPVATPVLRPSYDRQADSAFLLGALARLWLAGLPVDWTGFAAHEKRHRLRLPTYPFERRRYWIERPAAATVAVPMVSAGEADKPALVEVPAARHDRPANLRNAYAPPRNDEERRLAGIWESLLGVAPIGIHDSFFALGGHSLLAPQLLVHLRKAFSVDFPLAHLFEAPTIAELAEAIELLRTEGKEALAAREEAVDLRAEAVLDPGIQPESPWTGWSDRFANPAEVFLTGGTGFLGAHLLSELLLRTGARVHCLVRARDVAEGASRMREALESRALWRDEHADRIVPVPGDLGAPRFGLSEEEFRDLGRVDSIYHNGAWVNFTYPYKILKPSNVLGTAEVLRLASLGRVKPVHYVSSIAGIPEIEYGFREDPTVLEDDHLDSISGLFGGYGETKWVGEQLCRIARSRGIPVNIYRPTVLSGDSRTGIGNTRDMVWSLIKGAIQMGVAPAGDDPIDIAPVDYVAATLVHLSRQEESLNRLFHLPHPEVPRWPPVFDFLRRFGYPLDSMDTSDWLQHTLEVVKDDAAGENALAPFAPMVAIMDNYDAIVQAEGRTGTFRPLIFDDRNTREGLRGSGITCAPVDDRLLTTYFEEFIRIGFLPPPPRRSPTAGSA